MHARKHHLLLALWILCCGRVGVAQAYGGFAATFLRMGVGARAVSMGSSFVAVADDASAPYWNPAGLACNPGRQLVLSHHSFPLDRKNQYLSYKQSRGDAAFGFSWQIAGTDDIVARDSSGRKVGNLSDEQNAYAFSFAKQLGPKASFGLTGKLLRHELAGQKGKGSAFDVGLLVRPTGWLSVGVTLKELGGKVEWQNRYWERETAQEDEIPWTWTAGVSCALADKRLLVAADLDRTQNLGLKAGLGGELRIAPKVRLRAGATNLSADGDVDPAFSFGAGIALSENLDLDGGYVTDPIGAGGSQVWSLSFRL